MNFPTAAARAALSASTDSYPHRGMGQFKRTVAKSGCTQPGLVQEHCVLQTMNCLGKTLLWPSPSLAGGQSDSHHCPIPSGLEDPGALKGWRQSQPQYLEPEPLPALPGPTYTAKAVAESGTLPIPYPAQLPVHYQAGCSGKLLGWKGSLF